MNKNFNEFNQEEFIEDIKDLYTFMKKVLKISEEFFDLMYGNIYENHEISKHNYYEYDI